MNKEETIQKIKQIYGWGDFYDIHSYVIERLPGGSTAVELGVAAGRGLAMLALLGREKRLKVYGIDHFQGTAGESKDLYFNKEVCISRDNVIQTLSTVGLVEPDYQLVIGNTVDSSLLFETVNYVFLDADHSYNGVSGDIDVGEPGATSPFQI